MTIKGATLRAVKTSAETVDHFRRKTDGLVVLLYHRVGAGSGLESDMPAERFARQMEILAERGGAIHLDDAVASLPSSGRSPAVAVTFDDGTQDLIDIALPILERYRIPATIYVATDHIDRGIPFPHEGHPASWEGLRAAVATGLITIGSHTHTHALLDRLDIDGVRYELDRSKELIENEIGISPRHFAYPKAVEGPPAVRAAIEERFSSAAIGGNRPNRWGDAVPYRLFRSGIQVADGMRWFLKKVDGGMALEETLRRNLNRFRYIGASN
jgi:peptidoglycan/xylan/chitin deacetylase (PgdA/CDA1 family)